MFTSQHSQDEKKPQSESKESRTPYTIVYIFDGARKSYWVGHAAFWDGQKYYSFFNASLDQAWFFEAPPFLPEYPEATADKNADNQIPACGEWRKIIYPMTFQFDRKTAEDKITRNWKTSQYNLGFHNCVHQVIDHLVEAQIFTKKDVENIRFPTPSLLAQHCLEIGKKRFDQHLAEEIKAASSSKSENRRHYLLALSKDIHKKDTPIDIQIQLRPLLDVKNIIDMKKEDVDNLFFSIKQFMGEKHYGVQDEGMKFIAKWYALSFVPLTKIELTETKTEAQNRIAETLPDARYNLLLNTIRILCISLYDHFHITKGGILDKEMDVILRAFKGKRCLISVFKALLNVILSKLPEDAAIPRQEFIAGKKPLLYFQYHKPINAIMDRLQSFSWQERDANLFATGVIEIMQYAIKYSEFLLLDKMDDFKNLIESMRSIAQIDRVTNPKYKFMLPLKQVIDCHAKFSVIRSKLEDYDMARFVCLDFIEKMIMASAPKDYLDKIQIAFADGANPEIMAKKILIDIADRGSKVFGEGVKAKEFYQAFIEKLQDIDQLTEDAAFYSQSSKEQRPASFPSRRH